MGHAWLGRDIEREIADRQFPSALAGHLGVSTRILWSGILTTGVVTLSPLAHGHVVVFANTGHRSFSALIRDCPKAAAEAELAIAAHADIFGPSVMFEHGMNARGTLACGVSRAHFHLVPGQDVDRLTDSLARELGAPVASAAFWPAELAQCEYIAVGRAVNEGVFWQGRAFPSQIVRRHLAAINESDQWDWKELFGWDDMRTTVMSWQYQR